jgi:hypothetical protein
VVAKDGTVTVGESVVELEKFRLIVDGDVIVIV